MPGENVLYEIRQRINYEALFSEFLDMRGHGSERSAKCIFHDDSNPSMSVNISDGLFFCHGCGASGDFVDFFRRVRDLTFVEAVRELARRVGVEYRTDTEAGDSGVIDDSVITSAHERLLNTPPMLEYLEERRGVTEETVRRWQLGHDGQRYFIPIRDEVGRLVNIRRYKPDAARSHNKMISWRSGYGSARIWPFDSIERAAEEGDTLFLMEGEMDCLLALQEGLCAVTATGGAGTWRDAWNGLFAGRQVVICYDADEAGRSGAVHVAGKLVEVADEVRVVSIPLSEPPGADFTDYLHGHGHSAEDFMRLVGNTPPFTPSAQEDTEPIERDPEDLHLSQASRAEYYNARVRLPVVVSGKTMAPYLIPKSVRMSCPMPGLKMCERCPVASAAGSLLHNLDFESNEMLQFIDISDGQLEKQLKQKVGVPGKCGYVDIEVEESENVEQVQLIPEVARSDEDAPYVTRTAYYVGHGLESNRSYVMTGLTVPDPRKQLATHLIQNAVPSKSNIDAFRLTDDTVERLRAFQPEGESVESLWEKVDSIYDELEAATHIYQRRDLMLVVDLVFHSILGFTFQGEQVVRGWCEALIIGDSRTGKTATVQRMMEHYAAGEFSSGENTTLAGLVGGLHQIGNSWALQWGKVPLNDRRMLVIDEASNLEPRHIERMSSMRSSGVAEIVKVHTEKTNSRTRQVWISNPRGARPLSSYSQGVLAVKELIGAPEDIARFDLVATAASGDVSLDVINAPREGREVRTYTSDLCHQRVMWAWGRTGEHVWWTPEAEVRALYRATQQGQRYRYATEIPIVEPNEQRIKLARLAVAAAAMFFSTSEGGGGEPGQPGQYVVVREEHVDFAYEFLERLYAKPSLSFSEYADMQFRRHEIRHEARVSQIISGQRKMRALLEQERFIQRDLQEILEVDDRDVLRGYITALRTSGFIRRNGNSGYVKTPAAIRWLRDRLAEDDGSGLSGSSLAGYEVDDEEPPW